MSADIYKIFILFFNLSYFLLGALKQMRTTLSQYLRFLIEHKTDVAIGKNYIC